MITIELEEITENPNDKSTKLLDDFAKYLEDEENIYVTDVDYSTKTIYVDTIEDLKKSRYILKTEFSELKQLGAHVLSTIGADGLDKDYIADTKTQTESLTIEDNNYPETTTVKIYKLSNNSYSWIPVCTWDDIIEIDDQNNYFYLTRKNNQTLEYAKDSLWDGSYKYEIINKPTYKESLDDDFEQYTYVKSKEVYDSDGWRTEYTMYYDEVNDRYVFVFGDSDLYDPNDGYEEFDWECDTEREANEWFDNYEGFEDEFESKKMTESPRITKKQKDAMKQEIVDEFLSRAREEVAYIDKVGWSADTEIEIPAIIDDEDLWHRISQAVRKDGTFSYSVNESDKNHEPHYYYIIVRKLKKDDESFIAKESSDIWDVNIAAKQSADAALKNIKQGIEDFEIEINTKVDRPNFWKQFRKEMTENGLDFEIKGKDTEWNDHYYYMHLYNMNDDLDNAI